ncbi:charged multivesicular body protein 6 isoform X1 [Lutra lutra]|uniref:charged multivesicular body protein 6 isoform X1 n=1 Tax=Lutra lutra TaxID=9657 RepID=UPI001FD614C8|nr:charged multivesicular body protein 6 isoform X1 [Lutra lutra]
MRHLGLRRPDRQRPRAAVAVSGEGASESRTAGRPPARVRLLRRLAPRGRRRGRGFGTEAARAARGRGGRGGGRGGGPGRHGQPVRPQEAEPGHRARQGRPDRRPHRRNALCPHALTVASSEMTKFERNQLKQQRDKLKQYQKRITQQLEREREIARQLLRDGKKERAKLLLKKKRYREQLLDKTENQITSLETMVQSIEFTQIEMKVVEGLQIGNECLKKMHQVMSIEEVERILEETQEAVEYQRQIDELLAGSFTQEDEDAILEELNAITQEQIELPEVPSEPLPEKKPEKVPREAKPRQVELVAAS